MRYFSLSSTEKDQSLATGGESFRFKMLDLWNSCKTKRIHGKRHLRELFAGSCPIFVAALISRAVSALLDNIGSRTGILSALFAYAVLSHVIGFYVAINIPRDGKLQKFYSRIALENGSFSWKTFISLVVTTFLTSVQHVALLIPLWILIVALVTGFVILSNYLQIAFLTLSSEISQDLQVYDGEIFSLSIAYSLTLIVAASVYVDASSNYLTQLDDDTSINGNSKDKNLDWLFIIYVVSITFVVVVMNSYMRKRYNNQSHEDKSTNKDGSKAQGGKGILACVVDSFKETFLFWDKSGHTINSLQYLYIATAGYMVACAWYTWSVLSFQTLFTFMPGGSVLGLFIYAAFITLFLIAILTRKSIKKERKEIEEGEKMRMSSMNEKFSQWGNDMLEDNNDDEDTDEEAEEEGDTTEGIGGDAEVEVEGKQESKRVETAFHGNGVDSHSDEMKTHDHSGFDSASSIQSSGSHHFRSSSMSSLNKSTTVPTTCQNSQPSLLLIVGRLTVGWSWEEAITALFAHFIVNGNSRKKWVDTIVKCVVAFLAVILGARLDLYIQARRMRRKKRRERVTNDEEGSYANNHSVANALHDASINESLDSGASNHLRKPLLEQ